MLTASYCSLLHELGVPWIQLGSQCIAKMFHCKVKIKVISIRSAQCCPLFIDFLFRVIYLLIFLNSTKVSGMKSCLGSLNLSVAQCNKWMTYGQKDTSSLLDLDVRFLAYIQVKFDNKNKYPDPCLSVHSLINWRLCFQNYIDIYIASKIPSVTDLGP